MKKHERKSTSQKGSMMVEALALLGLITMVTPVLYRKAAERTTELQDINVATQMRMVSSAVDDFIKDNYNEIGESHAGDVFTLTEDEQEQLDKYLPYGFNTQSSRLFEDFNVSVRKRTVVDKNNKEHHIYTTAVLAPLREDITMMRSSKIASMIGANGGVYRRVGDGDNYMLEGVQGVWSADPSDYDFSGDIKEGSLVVISNEAISSASGEVSSDEHLYRIDDGDVNKNTMQTTLYMDGHDLRGLADLIAQGDTITIGSEDNGITNNLIVTGTSNLKGAVTAEGDVNVGGNLTVEGDTSLKKTTIEGDLIQSGGKIEFNPTDFTVNASGNINMDAGGNTTIGGTNVTISGDDTVKVNVGDKGITINKDGNIISGDTTFKEGDVTIDHGDLIVDGGEIIVYPENPDEETGITADWLYANVGVDVGGGDIVLRKGSGATINNGVDVPTGDITAETGDVIVEEGGLLVGGDTEDSADFVVSNSKVRVNNNDFAVGGNVGDEGNKIDTGDGHAFIGLAYDTSNDAHDGLMIESNSIILRNSVGNLKMVTGEVTLESTNSRVKLEDDAITIGVGEEGSEEAKIVADASKVGFENQGAGENATGTSLYLEDGKMKFGIDGNTQILVDKYGLAVAAEGGNLTGDSVNVADDGSVDGKSILDGSQVAISREGIIEVKAPTTSDNDGGFIRARRLVSDVPYPDNEDFYGYDIDGTNPSNPYDYYQVNPAYTSVMNDIKLASRGGARLSDILPDFINKGIYVVDNTYTNDSVGDWTTNLSISNGAVSTTVTECTDTSCIASPWMGFVPAPQCPKNYAKVISMSPIRWRMSEVYSIYGADTWGSEGGDSYESIVSGENFSTYFLRQTDPKRATFKLANSGGDDHTHLVESGNPLTFQTNTWLNTTISGNYGGTDSSGSVANFQGWHAIMGFVYRPTQYRQVLADLGENTATSEIYWNIFPVYGSEMAAVANVYCYFDRHPLTSTSGSREWTWGGNTPVYQYDQLNNFRVGYSKGSSGDAQAWGASSSDDPDVDRGAAINDPTLDYDDVW